MFLCGYQNNASLIEWGSILSSSHFCMHLYRISIISSLNVCWTFLCKKAFKYKFIFFDRYRVFRLLMSSWVSFGNLCFQWLCLSCQIYWHKVIHDILYYSFNTHKISSDITSFITDIGNFCLSISLSSSPCSQRICFWIHCYSLIVFLLSIFIGFVLFLVAFRKGGDSFLPFWQFAMQRRWYIPKDACCVINTSVWEHRSDSSAASSPRHGASTLP